MNRICLIEDSTDLQYAIKTRLQNWYEVVIAGDLKTAESLLNEEKIDLVLLDVALPDGSGFDFCAKLRNTPSTQSIPVIFLTGKADPTDKAMGFSLGADDYITKPFETLELKARIEARIRKRAPKSFDHVQTIGAFQFDRARLRASIVHGNSEQDLNLTAFEFRLLYFLASNEGSVYNRGTLLKSVLETNVHVNEDTIYTHISSLRKKMGKYAGALECLPRVGYRFNSTATLAA